MCSTASLKYSRAASGASSPLGELAFIPAGTVHTFANRGSAATRVLPVMTPEIDALISALHSGERDGTGETVWARYNSSVVDL